MYLTHTHTHNIIIFTISVHIPTVTGFVMHYSVANRNTEYCKIGLKDSS